MIEQRWIVVSTDIWLLNKIKSEDTFWEFDVRIDTFIDRLRLSYLAATRKFTIRKRPSIIAITPPVPDPPMSSKYWHGKGGDDSFCRPISSIISRRIRSADSPRTPPPSIAKSRGECVIDVFIATFRRMLVQMVYRFDSWFSLYLWRRVERVVTRERYLIARNSASDERRIKLKNNIKEMTRSSRVTCCSTAVETFLCFAQNFTF